MSLFDLQEVCIVIGSLATLDLPMVVDLIGIYVLKGPYCTLTTTNWFLQALLVIPRGSWGDVARRFTMIRWAAVDRQSGPRPKTIFLQSACTRKLMDFITDGNSSSRWPEQVWREAACGGRQAARGGREEKRGGRPICLVWRLGTCVTLNGSGIQLAVGPQPLRLRNHDFGLAQRIMVKLLETSRHDPLGITDSACKNQLVVVSIQYGPFNTYIPIRSTTIGKSRVARDPIAMHTSWRSNSDIASVTSIGYPRMRASVNPRQRSIDSYMHRDLTQSRRLMTPNASLELGRPYPHFDGPID
ncbi:hypothetical protein F511_26554 [Dorcoceras hygrometricum]|uniref:Uncharacterized protein n=1 Tax=Dorcoceras hygrometricum TaxID=472368 RepID=A0A2Z7CGK0_9LAMI|nr:hypothetical protein F511_26554 [Dorcoceras hygrometricum]